MSLRARFVFPGLLVAVAAVCIRLGIWQVDRLHQRRAANAQAERALALPPVELTGTVAAAGAALAHRRVHARGRYDRAHEIVLRGMTASDLPGVHVVTPLLLDGGAVLVKRGFAPAPDAVSATLDSLDEPGVVSVSGVALALESRPDGGRPLARSGRETWGRLDLAALRARLPYPILDIFIQQLPDSSLPRSPRRLDLPPRDDGPHLSYAIQWFAFATTALVMAGIFALRSPGSARRAAE